MIDCLGKASLISRNYKSHMFQGNLGQHMNSKVAGIEKQWLSANGMRCMVVIHPMKHRCGYVEISSSNGLYEEAYDKIYDENISIEVHGGITFSGRLDSADGYWLGYDCAHSMDKTSFNPKGIERSLEYCVEQCELLSRQIHDNSIISLWFLSKKQNLNEEQNRLMISYGLIPNLPNNNLVKDYFRNRS